VTYQTRVLEHIQDIAASDWNALGVAGYPFLRHEFLDALEQTGCLGERWGWIPRHLAISDQHGKLLAAAPLYLKFNSYGEFVFDWSWADAYQRNGLSYYPKLVSASPYTPATGPKLLLAPEAPPEMPGLLMQGALELARQAGCSSLHWLFPPDRQIEAFEASGFMRRTGCQFHWQNRGYRDFEDFLATFSSAKRKQVRRERRRVSEAGITFRLLDGTQAEEQDWRDFHALYESTFDKRGGMPTLSLAFFQRIARLLPRSVLLVQALHQGKVVAAAFNLVGEDTLYGRHWGCREEFHSLHFEACYYQGLQYCIENGLQRFEPGAQGEHKISRGFLPTPTWSAHWLADERFSRAVRHFLETEDEAMQDYMQELHTHSPYKQPA
jgi:predicted N-acyltransferase